MGGEIRWSVDERGVRFVITMAEVWEVREVGEGLSDGVGGHNILKLM